MDRYLWLKTISSTRCPPWPCPVCHRGTMFLKKDSLVSGETVPSKRSRNFEHFDPMESIDYIFTAWAVCSNDSCQEEFVISGNGGVGAEYNNEGNDWNYEDYFLPRHCYPMPHIISIPRKCPSEVALELEAAFIVFWSNPAACAGRIRVAVELLMNHVGIQKKKKNKQGKFYDLSLHARVEIFSQRNKLIGPRLMALKWIGNSGSHVGDIRKIELLDAFELLEDALMEIVDKRSERLAELAKKMTREHRSR
jgi:hypothetical protein